MIVGDFAYEFRPQGLPLAGTFRAPPAGAARRPAGETRRANQRFDYALQILALGGVEAGSEAHVIKQAFGVVEAQQKRSNPSPFFCVAKAADHAVDAANALH